MFSTPTLRAFNHQENKDALMTRKPGFTNSARKPLGDRSNKDETQNEMKSLKVPLSDLKIPNKEMFKPASVKKTSPKNNNNTNYPDWYADMCSFNEIEDSYEDILPKSQRLAFNFNTIRPRTPTPTINIEIDPMVFELPDEKVFRFEDSPKLEMIEIEDVEFPDFESFEDMQL